MSISGFDDPDWFSYWEPPITTVAMDLNRLSQMTVDMLIERMANDVSADRSVYGTVPISFVVRSSTARPAGPGNAEGA
jgi:DNA-binding LacI/PurR family transcriptional regulator